MPSIFNTSDKISILSPSAERGSVGLGLLFVAIGYWGVFFSPRLSFTTLQWYHIIVAVFFLKATHTVFTFTLFATIPEFRALLRDSIKIRAPWIPLSIVLMAIVVYQVTQYGSWQGPVDTDLITAALQGITLTHAARQTFGLLLLYNRAEERAGQAPADRQEQIARDETAQRWLATILIFILTIEPFSTLGGVAYKKSLEPVILFIKAILVLSLLILIWRGGQWRRSNKALFSLRILALPFAFNSLHLLRASGMIHGVESLYMCLQIVKRSASRNIGLGRRPFWALMISMIVFGAMILLYFAEGVDPELVAEVSNARPRSENSRVNDLILMNSCIIFAIGFFHNYVDSIVYRMRDPLVRKHIGPLIL